MSGRGSFSLERVRARLSGEGGARFWSDIEELLDDNYFRGLMAAEFPSAAELLDDPQRRHVLKLMGASLLLGGLGSCSPDASEGALPYVNQPENLLPGVPRYFATAVTLEGYAQPVIATTYDGRPTKLDGNPDHPTTQGRSDSFMQAAVLGLYDPERARGPTRNGDPATWGAFQAELAEWRPQWLESRGRGLRIVLSPTTSATLERQIKALLADLPEAQLSLCDPLGAARGAAMRAVLGGAAEPHVAFADCEVIVSLDDDFLGPGPHQVRNALGFAQRRGDAVPGQGRSRLFAAESVPGATGALASARLAVVPSRMRDLLQALAGDLVALAEHERQWIEKARAALHKHGGRGVILTGVHLPPDVHALAAELNGRLGNIGRTIRHSEPIRVDFAGISGLPELANDIAAGKVETLIAIDCNPVYAAPAALDLIDLIAGVRHRISASLYRDETAALCQWHVPLSHELESWSDARAVDGTLSILQPVIRPLYSTRSIHQVIGMLAGAVEPTADAEVKAMWRERFGNDPSRWRRALHDGFVEGTAAKFVSVNAPGELARDIGGSGEVEFVFKPDPAIWNGRFSNIASLQELPKPLTKITWSNVIAVGPQLAERLGVSNSDRVTVESGGREIEGPAWIVPGQAVNVVGLTLGYGRRAGGSVSEGLGYDAYALLPGDGTLAARGSIRRASGTAQVATTQAHHRIDGFDFIREVTATNPRTAPPKDNSTLYPEWTGDDAVGWGMVIDLDLCIGCNACIEACNIENNVPVVGKDQVTRGRDMAWLRVDRYYRGDVEAPRTFFQPVPCMHCEKAPCEMGCPVNATVHSPDGINQQVYNRCIGTRTCSSFCPYKVRRFNWYDYRRFDAANRAAQNPDVTVRSRGVMEKCTYCTQRVQAARVAADKEQRAIRDGDVITACQQACPTQAIVFGNIKDSSSKVANRRGSGRHYILLEELGTLPRTTYLARWDDGESGEGA